MRAVSRQAVKMGMGILHEDRMSISTFAKGSFIVDMRDGKTGEQLLYWEKDNVIVRDAGILAARLFRDSTEPNVGVNNGLKMLAVGTGATGSILSPDAPQVTQRALNTELARKAFASAVFRNLDGIAVSIPTNIVDFTTTFSESEAVGALNEMAVMSPFSSNPAVTNPILNGPANYDPTIDVSSLDLLANYLTFPVISKPSTAILSITWRLTF
jgi:hypothetical protein